MSGNWRQLFSRGSNRAQRETLADQEDAMRRRMGPYQCRYMLSRMHSVNAQMCLENNDLQMANINYCRAAKEMYDFYKTQVVCGTEIKNYYAEDIASFYRKAAHTCHSMRNVHALAAVVLEGARCLTAMQEYTTAYNFFDYVMQFEQQLEIQVRRRIFTDMLSILMQLGRFADMLEVNDKIWMTTMRDFDNSALMTHLLNDTELVTILLMHMNMGLETTTRHRFLLNAYKLDDPNAELEELSPTVSKMSMIERKKFRNFLLLIKARKFDEAALLLPSSDVRLLTPIGNESEARREIMFWTKTSFTLALAYFGYQRAF